MTDWTFRFRPFGPNPRPTPRPGFAVVRERLLVGEFPTPDDAAWLADTHGVTAVVSLQDDTDLAAKGLVLAELEAAYRAAGVAFHRVPIPDGSEGHLAARLDEVVGLVARLVESGRVYLHCNAGYNRAPTVAIAYLCRAEGLAPAAARAAVKACRPCVPYMRAIEAWARGR